MLLSPTSKVSGARRAVCRSRKQRKFCSVMAFSVMYGVSMADAAWSSRRIIPGASGRGHDFTSSPRRSSRSPRPASGPSPTVSWRCPRAPPSPRSAAPRTCRPSPRRHTCARTEARPGAAVARQLVALHGALRLPPHRPPGLSRTDRHARDRHADLARQGSDGPRMHPLGAGVGHGDGPAQRQSGRCCRCSVHSTTSARYSQGCGHRHRDGAGVDRLSASSWRSFLVLGGEVREVRPTWDRTIDTAGRVDLKAKRDTLEIGDAARRLGDTCSPCAATGRDPAQDAPGYLGIPAVAPRLPVVVRDRRRRRTIRASLLRRRGHVVQNKVEATYAARTCSSGADG